MGFRECDILPSIEEGGIDVHMLGKFTVDGEFYLLSSMFTPLITGQATEFTVLKMSNDFNLKGKDIKFYWTISKIEGANIPDDYSKRTNSSGTFIWMPKSAGIYRIKVGVGKNETEFLVELSMTFGVIDPELYPGDAYVAGGLNMREIIDGAKGKNIGKKVFAGSIDKVKSLFFNYWQYIKEPLPEGRFPEDLVKLISAVVYDYLKPYFWKEMKDGKFYCMQFRDKKSPIKLGEVGALIKKKGLSEKIATLKRIGKRNIKRKIGLCQIDITTAFYRCNIPDEGELSPIKVKKKLIKNCNESLNEDQKKNLFNILRFPRSNIWLAKEMFTAIDNVVRSDEERRLDKLIILFKAGVIKASNFSRLIDLNSKGCFVIKRSIRDDLKEAAKEEIRSWFKFRKRVSRNILLPIFTIFFNDDTNSYINRVYKEWLGIGTEETFDIRKTHFRNSFMRYLLLRPLYVKSKEKIEIESNDPDSYNAGLMYWIRHNIKEVQLNVKESPFSSESAHNGKVFVHDDIVDMLEGAFNEIGKRETQTPIRIDRIGGFVPRLIGGKTSLSDHAFGMAVDINHIILPDEGPYKTNRHLLTENEVKIICYIVNKYLPTEDRSREDDYPISFPRKYEKSERSIFESEPILNSFYKRIKKLSDAYVRAYPYFKNDFYDNNEEESEEERIEKDGIKKILRNDRKLRERLTKYKEVGFLTLDWLVVDEMIKAGFDWGGRFYDFMHFQK